MKDKNVKNRIHTFVKKEVLCVCPYCEENIYEDNLFVEKDEELFHLSCHNNKAKEDKK